MRVIDTSAWIETLKGTAIGHRLNAEIPAPEDCIVPTLVQLELAKWLTREQPPEQAERVIAYTMTCQVVALDSVIALLAADLGVTHGLATADAIIYATAVHRNAVLVTCDAHFDGLPLVHYFAKHADPE